MAYSYILAQTAQQDFEQLMEHLREHVSQSFADTVGRAVKEKIQNLLKEPELYQVMEQPRFKALGIRSIPVEGHIVYYRIDARKEQVQILRIRSEKQDNRRLTMCEKD